MEHEFCCSDRPQNEHERMWKYLYLARGLKKTMEHVSTVTSRTTPQGVWKETNGIGNERKNEDHTDHSIVKIC